MRLPVERSLRQYEKLNERSIVASTTERGVTMAPFQDAGRCDSVTPAAFGKPGEAAHFRRPGWPGRGWRRSC